MDAIQIRAFDKPIEIFFDGQKVSLPDDLTKEIQKNWRQLTEKNPKLRNGEVFTVTDVKETPTLISVKLAETDYAHYLYSYQQGSLGEYTVRIIHPSALIMTADDVMILGSMGQHTSRPGVIQCCGGGIDRNALESDGHINIERTIMTELQEELGLDMYDDQLIVSAAPKYLKFGGPTGKMTVVYVVEINQTVEQFREHYGRFANELISRGEDPEFDELLELAARPTVIEDFIDRNEGRLSEYIPVLLRAVAI